MTIDDAARKYRLPNPTTPEDLECRWSKVLTFDDKIILVGDCWNEQNKHAYFGAIYEYLEDGRHDCESAVGLWAVSEVVFEDDGHAIGWAIQNINKGCTEMESSLER